MVGGGMQLLWKDVKSFLSCVTCCIKRVASHGCLYCSNRVFCILVSLFSLFSPFFFVKLVVFLVKSKSTLVFLVQEERAWCSNFLQLLSLLKSNTKRKHAHPVITQTSQVSTVLSAWE